MIAIPAVLAFVAREAGMRVPEDPEEYDKEKYPHWHVYVSMQLGAPTPHPTAHWDNDKVVVDVPHNRIRKITLDQLEKRGFRIGSSNLHYGRRG